MFCVLDRFLIFLSMTHCDNRHLIVADCTSFVFYGLYVTGSVDVDTYLMVCENQGLKNFEILVVLYPLPPQTHTQNLGFVLALSKGLS